MQDRRVALVTGAFGQLGTDLVPRLLDENFSVVCVAHKNRGNVGWIDRVRIISGDVTDAGFVRRVVQEEKPEFVFHLAGVLSAVGESDPSRAWSVNLDSLRYFLEAATQVSFRLFWASSIAVFGPNTPKIAPEDGPFGAKTVYGIAKKAGEVWRKVKSLCSCSFFFL